MDGWIKLHRKLMESDTFHRLTAIQKLIAIYIILNANHDDGVWYDKYKNIEVKIKRGQLITSRNKIAKDWFQNDKDVSDMKIRTCLDKLEKLGFLTKSTTSDYTLLTVLNYEVYQGSDKDDIQQDNQVPTKSQPSDNQAITTNKNDKNDKNKNIVEIVGYLNERVGANFSSSTKKTMELISGRLKEGRTLEDFKKVIDVKAEEWLGKDREMYLRPNTLFTPTNFENYLNQANRKKKGGKVPELDLFTPSEEDVNFLNDIYKRRGETGDSE